MIVCWWKRRFESGTETESLQIVSKDTKENVQHVLYFSPCLCVVIWNRCVETHLQHTTGGKMLDTPIRACEEKNDST